MKEREQVHIEFVDGSYRSSDNAEVTRDGGVLTVFADNGSVLRANWNNVLHYTTIRSEVKNLDD